MLGGLGDPGSQAGLIQLSQQPTPEQPQPRKTRACISSLKRILDSCLFSVTTVDATIALIEV